MYKSNPYQEVPSEEVIKETNVLNAAIYDSQTMLSCLLHLSHSSNPNIAEKAKTAYSALLEVKDLAITAKAYATQKLAMDFEEMNNR